MKRIWIAGIFLVSSLMQASGNEKKQSRSGEKFLDPHVGTRTSIVTPDGPDYINVARLKRKDQREEGALASSDSDEKVNFPTARPERKSDKQRDLVTLSVLANRRQEKSEQKDKK